MAATEAGSRRRILLVAGLALLGAGGTVAFEAAGRAAPPPRPPVALFFGSSTVAGAGASQAARRWTSLASAHCGWRERNAGLPGSTVTPVHALARPPPVDSAYERWAALPAEPRPDVVILQYGANDILQRAPLGSPHDEATFEGALARVLAGLRERYPAATLVVVAPQPAPALAARRAAYDRALERQALAHGALHVWLPTEASDSWRGGFPDRLHLDDEGHATLAREVVRQVGHAVPGRCAASAP